MEELRRELTEPGATWGVPDRDRRAAVWWLYECSPGFMSWWGPVSQSLGEGAVVDLGIDETRVAYSGVHNPSHDAVGALRRARRLGTGDGARVLAPNSGHLAELDISPWQGGMPEEPAAPVSLALAAGAALDPTATPQLLASLVDPTRGFDPRPTGKAGRVRSHPDWRLLASLVDPTGSALPPMGGPTGEAGRAPTPHLLASLVESSHVICGCRDHGEPPAPAHREP